MTNPISKLDPGKIQFVFDNLLVPFMVCNKETEILYGNQIFTTFSGLTPRELKKNPKLNEYLKTENFDLKGFIQDCFKKASPLLSEEIKMDFSGHEISQYGVIRSIPLNLNGEEFLGLCFNNLSVEHNLYEKYRDKLDELKKTHQQIIQADKLTTMGELTASISHEISNPLTIALGNIEVLEMSLNEKENAPQDFLDFKSYISNVNESLKRISSIIENMKEYLHKAEDTKEYCRYFDIIENSVNLLGPAYRSKNVKIIKNIEEPHLVGHLNKIKIEQVLINLLKNSLDAISNQDDNKNGLVEIHLKRDSKNNLVLLEVLDNGPGIKEKDLNNLFTPFFTTKKVGEGMGLGLSISYKTIESHHGKIEALNRKDQSGAHFKISLPVLENISFTNNDRYLTGMVHKEDLKVLVVDNDVVILNILDKILTEAGIVFIGSTNPQEALHFLQKFPTDLILTDIEMPLLNGPSFAKLIRDKGIKIPLIYFSSEDKRQIFIKDKESLGISDFISKPFTATQVLDILKKYLKREKTL